MDIVDTVHLGPGGAAELVAAMDALGIKSALVDEWWHGRLGEPGYRVGDGAVRATSPTAELASWTFPGRLSYLVRVDRRDPDLAAVVRFARDASFARALRASPGMPMTELAAFAEGAYDPIFAAAADYGLPILVDIGGHTPLLERCATKFPDTRIIINHCGMPPGKLLLPVVERLEGNPDSARYWRELAAEPLSEAFEKVLRLADWPNVALKWSHAPAMFDAGGYPNAATRPFLRKALGTFGAERVMWASDITANPTGESWAELLFAIVENPELSAEEREWLLGKTARQWLNWDG